MTTEEFWLPESESRRRFKAEMADSESEELEEISGDGTEEYYSHELIPLGLVPTDDFFRETGFTLEEVYDWYRDAISRRGREPLELDRFVGHFEATSLDPTYAFGNREDGFALGYLKYGVFVPTHFAPNTMRGGYRLIKDLGESVNIPCVMSITEDLVETVSKLPSWHVIDVNFLAMFREQLMGKQIVYNSHPDTRNLMLGLVAEYLEESEEEEDA